MSNGLIAIVLVAVFILTATVVICLLNKAPIIEDPEELADQKQGDVDAYDGEETTAPQSLDHPWNAAGPNYMVDADDPKFAIPVDGNFPELEGNQ